MQRRGNPESASCGPGWRTPRSPKNPSPEISLQSPAPLGGPEVRVSLSQPRSSAGTRRASASNLCPSESLKSIFSARHPSPPGWEAGGGGEPRSPPRPGVCVSCVFGARASCAPSALALAAPRSGCRPAPRDPLCVAGQHGPGRGAAEDCQKTGEDGDQEEHGEAAEFGPQPPSSEARRWQPRALGARGSGAPWVPPAGQGTRGRPAGTGPPPPRGHLLGTWGGRVQAREVQLVHVPQDVQGSALGSRCGAREEGGES
jgi:hypothetical protein